MLILRSKCVDLARTSRREDVLTQGDAFDVWRLIEDCTSEQVRCHQSGPTLFPVETVVLLPVNDEQFPGDGVEEILQH